MANTDVERARALAWLATAPGARLIETAGAMPSDRLTRLSRLRKLAPQGIAAAAVELLELRKRARAKFADAGAMFFTPEGLEQATGDAIAAYRASRFASDAGILDACCGIGGDARHLAHRGPVLAVDRSPAAAICARLNSEACTEPASTGQSVRVVCADATSLSLQRLAAGGVRSALFDPSRRGDRADGGRARMNSASDYSPPLSWLESLRGAFESVAVKVSPAIDDGAVRFPGVRVEFLSDRRECKEAVLWFGPLADALALPKGAAEPYFATVIRAGEPPATLAPFACPPIDFGEIAEYLYEPDPSVIRAHLVPQWAAEFEGRFIEPGIPYLTSAAHAVSPFGTAFRVVEALGFRIKEVQRRLRALGAHITAVKKRGVPYEPSAVQRALTPCGERELVLVLMRRGGHIIAILCERLAGV